MTAADRVRAYLDGITERLALLHDIAEQSRGLGHDVEAYWIDAAAGAVEAVLALADCGQTTGNGCCSLCDGSGYSGEEATGGMCSDCRATGHAHGPVTGDDVMEFIDEIRRAVAVHLDPGATT